MVSELFQSCWIGEVRSHYYLCPYCEYKVARLYMIMYGLVWSGISLYGLEWSSIIFIWVVELVLRCIILYVLGVSCVFGLVGSCMVLHSPLWRGCPLKLLDGRGSPKRGNKGPIWVKSVWFMTNLMIYQKKGERLQYDLSMIHAYYLFTFSIPTKNIQTQTNGSHVLIFSSKEDEFVSTIDTSKCWRWDYIRESEIVDSRLWTTMFHCHPSCICNTIFQVYFKYHTEYIYYILIIIHNI